MLKTLRDIQRRPENILRNIMEKERGKSGAEEY